MSVGLSVNRSEFIRQCFLTACHLDVLVCKPGNVSVGAAGHGMDAQMFITSAEAAAGPLCAPGQPVGARIEAAVAATWAAVGCNTNLGIVLLAAPLAAAAERAGALDSPLALRQAIEAVLAGLTLDDARAAYHAIAQANPGGLGRAEHEDVHAAPSLDLRAAMALATDRDSIARQYARGYAELFDIGLAAWPGGRLLSSRELQGEPDAALQRTVQAIYLAWLGAVPDSHIVRKHGEAVAHTVMAAAQGWRGRDPIVEDSAWRAWDAQLKAARINPGTSADLTVATLMMAALLVGTD